ncbi:MAG: hypothetical protein AMJ78_08655 [Omnitrophica WOR_2 bacterium SM23_29]|nr:MAG: hypothetical protein AMJ78_08655 [Omnitrophica WOR_2 bacterium SM23_29]
MSITNVVQAIRGNKRFLIAGHINPEADAVGSQLALASLLKRLGKGVLIVNEDPPPESCKFLPNIKSIKLFKDVKESYFKRPDCAIIVDCPVLDRIGKVKELITDGVILVGIDHHISNERYGDINWIDLKSSAVGEMVFEIFKRFKLKLNKEEATQLYTAILIDTGSFRYSNTTERTHRIAAELIKYGLDTDSIYKQLYELKAFPATQLLGLSLSTIKKSRDGKVVWFWLTRQMLKQAGARFDDAENFINYARAVKGVKVAIFLKETDKKGKVQISLRGRKGCDVNKIASRFGGGGHARAAGCTITGIPKEAERKILRAVFKVV